MEETQECEEYDCDCYETMDIAERVVNNILGIETEDCE